MAAVNEPSGSIWIINPDELARRIAEQEDLPLQPANLEAVRRIESWLFTSLDAYQTIGVETVLSTDKYRRLVEHARKRGFSVSLIYVFLETAELNVERVATRVRKGGHAVPEDKIQGAGTALSRSSAGSSMRRTRSMSTTTPARDPSGS